LKPGDDDIMPPKGNPLAKTQTDILRAWMNKARHGRQRSARQSAANRFREGHSASALNSIVWPVIAKATRSGLRLDKASEAFKGGEGGPAIVRHRPRASLVYHLDNGIAQ